MQAVGVKQLLELSIALSSEKDGDALLEKILTAAMDIAECDGGTLYIRDGEELRFKLMITRSTGTRQGGRHGAIAMPPVPLARGNICACAALDGILINLSDVYRSDRYDFSGPRRYDAMTGYHTTSMLVAPMENDRREVIGVLQLINALDGRGSAVPFPTECEQVIAALASLAAISLTNMNYAQEVREVLRSLAGALSTAIDARSPYNANHTRNMARVAGQFIDWLNRSEQGWRFTEEEREEFLMSVWLHDVGKLTIPLGVMDKETRLGGNLARVRERLTKIELLYRLRALESGETCDELLRELEQARALVDKANTAGFLSDELLAAVKALGTRVYEDENGASAPWITGEEMTELSVRRGTLTDQERAVMESHAAMTARILDGVHFGGAYARSAKWANQHHELLDGSGYPGHLCGEELCRETRLLTILDIFDALTAPDRPYRGPMSLEKALEILHAMAEEGKLDPSILALFIQSCAWEEKK